MTEQAPAPFENLRQYLESAVEQLLKEMSDQQVAYAVPSDDVLDLVRRVAALEQRSVWRELESWALRHAIPIHDIIHSPKKPTDDPTLEQQLILRKRLRDLLGYIILGLVLTE